MSDSTTRKRILVTGATGLVGSALLPLLASRGHKTIPLLRTTGRRSDSKPAWDLDKGEIQLAPAGPLDAVIHLAGETIAQRWSSEAKRRIRQSRVDGTRLLAGALANLPSPPRVLICASATGFYGDRGDNWLDETSPPGTGFLAETCHAWEAAADPARASGVRVVHLRFGIVLSANGGALGKMLPAFQLGAGGRLGNGQAWWSWIAIDDLLEAICHALDSDSTAGPMNAVSPHPVMNGEFARTLARVLRRPACLPVPVFALKVLFGEMAKEAMLASARVTPGRLLQTGFVFRFGELEPALRHLLDRSR